MPERYSLERAQEEAAKLSEKMAAGEAKDYGEAERKLRLATHKQELMAYGLRGLEGRMQRGLDPAGMLAVGETRELVERLAKESEVDIKAIDEITKDLHVGAIWSRADDLAEAEKPEVRAWMLLVNATHEVNDRDLKEDEYLKDVERIKGDFSAAMEDPDKATVKAAENILTRAKEKFEMRGGVPFATSDAFLDMAIAGEKYGVCQAGELYFVGSNKLDYSTLTQAGLTVIEREDRGRTAKFYQKDGKDAVKELYPGLAIVFGDEKLALELAESAKKFAAEEPEKEAKAGDRVEKRLAEIRESIPERSLPQVLDEIKEYLALRQFNDYENPKDPSGLPDEVMIRLKRRIGFVADNLVDSKIEWMESFEPWFDMSDTYGDWSEDEVGRLISELEK